MPRVLSLSSLRLTIFAAAGLGAGACVEEMINPIAQGSSGSTGTTTGSGGGGAAGGQGGGTTGVGGQGGSGGAGGSGGSSFVDPVCEGAVLVFSNTGGPTGFAQCPDGTYHRIEPVVCDPTLDAPSCTGGEVFVNCLSDAECTEGPNGRCVTTVKFTDDGLTSFCGCAYTCSSDAECGPGKACICRGFLGLDDDWSTCAPSTCATGADCESGECGLSIYENGCFVELGLGCRADSDVCRTFEQCNDASGPFEQCILPEPPSTEWACVGLTCSLGRPLRIEGKVTLAREVERPDFCASPRPETNGLDAGLREALARHWLEVAALEHASVGSFARFTLELLTLGAPPRLLSEAQRAGLDEVEHAALAYGLASAYAGRGLGPGPLPLSGLQIAEDRLAILRALVEEGCVGETLGAAEALALADRARDPVLREAHLRIAGDEERHAALAWKTLAWMLDQGEVEERDFVRSCFEEASSAAGRDPARRARSAPEHGLLAADELGALRRQALREVIEPCATALLNVNESR